MGELMDAAAAVSEQIGIPREILSGLPVVEMTGDAAVMIEQHHGICAYSEQEVCIKVNFGQIAVCGSGLTIRVMNRRRMILYGHIKAVRFERRQR